MPDNKETTKKPTLSAAEKAEWNALLDFMNTKGLRGSKDLDKGDDTLAKSIVEEYRKTNPAATITYDKVKPIQEAVLSDYDTMNKIRQLQGGQPDTRPLSPVDGRLGSLTSNAYFPVARTTDAKGKMVKDWGHDIDGYYNYLNSQIPQAPPIDPSKFKAMNSLPNNSL